MNNTIKHLLTLTRVRVAILFLAFGFAPFALLSMAVSALQR